jgi:alkaline phosphatase D
MKVRSHHLLVLGLTILLACQRKQEVPDIETYVVMVSFDGFRWDYTSLYDTPHFDELEEEGVRASRLIPSFPTKTFPNHYTLATGLYPDHHGIINNSFYANDLGKIYRIRDRSMVMNGKSYFGEPIWITAEKQGQRTASYFWVGSEAAVSGVRPSYWKEYDGTIPYQKRVEQVIDWLQLPMHKRPSLVTLYFDEPDHTGHEAGPEHPETGKVVNNADRILGMLRDGLAKLDISDRVNLIVLSDHGMAPVSDRRYVNLEDHLEEHWTESIIGGNPVLLADPAEGMADSICAVIDRVEGVSAWQKHDMPAHFHYGTHPRFPGIVIVADSLWSVGVGKDDTPGYVGGAHGYDPDFSDMHTIFFADGPAFKSNYRRPPFSNVEVYGIIAHVLGLEPADTDGDLSRVMDLFITE